MSEVKPKVLIIDDEVVSATALAIQLESDYEVTINHDGLDVLKVVKEFNADIILLDILLPDTSGYEIYETLKGNEETQDIPVVFVTGLEESFNEQIGLDLGALDYITKPISLGILKTRMARILTMNLYIEFLEHLLGEKDIALTTLQQEASLLLNNKAD